MRFSNRANSFSLEKLTHWLFGLFILSLPFNSFPYLPSVLGGKAVVRPLVLYPLIGLTLIVVIPKLFNQKLPIAAVPLLVFTLVGLLSSILALFAGVEPFRKVTVGDRLIRSLFSLGLGVLIYFMVIFMVQKKSDILKLIKWVYFSGAIAFVIGALQSIYVFTKSESWFVLMSKFQKLFSTRKLFIDRVSGPTYEPNWFADQIVLVYLPFLLGAVITGYSISSKRFLRISLEGWLLLLAVYNLLLTFSRGGLLVLAPTLGLGLLLYWGNERSLRAGEGRKEMIVSTMKILSIGFLVFVILLSAVFYFGQNNPLFTRLWDYDNARVEVNSFSDYLFVVGVDSRLIYWRTAYNVFEEHPILGVGMGNYAFYFYDYMPDKHLGLYPEVLRYIVPEKGRNQLITPKNFYLRVMAETGVVGFAVFSSFIIAVFGSALYLYFSRDSEERYFGVVGIITIFVFLLSAVSFDSFSFPNMWFMFGVITASSQVFRMGFGDQNMENSGVV